MRRDESLEYFRRTVPERFRADAGAGGADAAQTEAALADAREFFDRCARYQVVAEVVEASCCMAGIRPGHRYVIQGANLDLEQTTGPVCVFLTAMLVQRVAAAFERFGAGEPANLALPGAHCTDPGPAVGGFGSVKVRMWLEPVPE